MAGHSHFKSIKHKKAAVDAKRSKYFSKYSKALMVAARAGGGDPDKNLSLQYAIDRARAGNMPNDSIDRAIKRATGELGNVEFSEVVYEGYAPGGVAVIAEAVTDNRSRTAPEVRKVFSHNGGNLGNPGSVMYMFERKGLIGIPSAAASFDEVFEVALEAGAEDVQPGDDQHQVTTSATSFALVKKALADKGWELSTAELAYVAQNTVTPDADTAKKVEALLSELEDNDDVQNVYSNYVPADEA
ncbi:MAG: YebC/PmpR family DNA-binding transcriptional regulator [Planctomycetota bacterium]|nr:YebC/PmpR family DNA-binding transcriptional regulator [Planctomycetota bacterium]